MLTITLLSIIVAAAAVFIAWRSIRREHLRSTARVASLATAIDDTGLPASAVDATPAIEHSIEFDFRSSMRRRLVTAISGAAVVVAGVVTIAMMGDRHEPPPRPVVSPRAEPLDLLSLHADREGSTLAITGLVRSRAEEPLAMVTAVVSAIDAKGRRVGRGSVPLAVIQPRGESRFVVMIPNVGEAARYRVSFRGATGVIRHVDRRASHASDVL